MSSIDEYSRRKITELQEKITYLLSLVEELTARVNDIDEVTPGYDNKNS